ncbi:hypothetical protein IDJ75_10630 [Mucilaginibacter rigui]|uniref:Bacteriophage tail tape measure N-terminal domain-containing protein n=1 Tax=Mucilaginibacter rigui TaxID=534635 RepID=A0ABR7X585_9SPHI|nr:hypothetical protein [Mucilaginibacter rigui]MBD1385734.1 hypothetical protein [Mucilaginibacter rigui]
MSDLDLDIEFRINDAETERQLNSTRERIRSVGTEARTQGQVVRQSFNGLQNSINQIGRELPAFTYSAQTGFMAIANNIPILTDEIGRLRAANAQLTASGQTAVPVWRQVVSGLFSWGTAMSVGITLMTVYGKELGNLITSLFKGKDAINNALLALKNFNEVMAKANEAAAPQISKLKILYSVTQDVTQAMEERVKAAQELKKEFPNEFANASSLQIINGKLASSYDDVTKSIMSQARAKAGLDKITELEKTKLNAEIQKQKIRSAENYATQKAIKSDVDFTMNKNPGMTLEEAKAYVLSHQAVMQRNKVGADVVLKSGMASGVDLIHGSAVEAAKAQDEIINSTKIQQENIQKLVGGGAKIASVIEGNNKLIQDPLKNFDAIVKNASQKADLEILEKSLQAKLDALAPNDKQRALLSDKIEQVKKIIKDAYTIDDGKSANDALKNITDSSESVYKQLQALDAEYSRKGFTKDEEEKQALKDKFTAFRKIIADENAKIAEYNKTHKKQIGTIDVGAVQPIEDKATADLTYRQDTAKLKTSLDEQKKLYREYEDYKTSFGETKANERYSWDLDTSKTYLQKLTDEYNKLTDQQSAAPLTGVQKERLKMLGDGIKAEQSLTEANFTKLLADNQSFEDKRTAIQENAMAKIQELRSKGNTVEADNLRKKTEAELTEFDKKRVEQLDSYKELYDNLDHMSTSALRKSLAGLQSQVSKLALTPKAKEFFDKLFGDMQFRIDSKSGSDFKNIASSLNDAAQYAGNLSEGLGSALRTAADLVGQVGNIKQGMADFKKASTDKDMFGQISAGLGMVGAAIGIISTIGGLFSNAKAKAEQQKYITDLQLKATEAVNKALERQLALTKETYGPERLVAYKKSLEDIAKAQADASAKLAGRTTLSGIKVLDEKYINQLNNGEKPLNQLLESMYKGAVAQNAVISLTGKSIEDLTRLMDEGKLDERTAAIVKSMIDLKQQAKDTANALTEEITGVNFDSLNEEIRGIFDSGEADSQKFADAIEKNIRRAFSNAFKRNEIEKAMQPFYDQLYKAGEDGVFSQNEIDTLRAQKDAIAKLLADKAAAYEKIIGADDTVTNTDNNSLQGAYKTASQESIDLLSANTGGLRLAAVEGNNLTRAGNKTLSDGLDEMKKHTLSLMEISVNTKVSADYAPYLKHLESMDKKMDDYKNYSAGMGRVV